MVAIRYGLLMPSPPVTERSATTVTIDGRTLIAFGGCDYLGLAHHYAVIDSLGKAVDRYGLSASASRETTGNTRAHDRLEIDLARFASMPGAIVLPEGFLANIAVCQGLAAMGVTIAIIDEVAHQSLHDAAVTAGLAIECYDHGDAAGALTLAQRHGAAVILTDGVFTADGAVAPIDELARGLGEGAWLVVDDCHGFGVLGDRGRGTLEHFAITDERVIVTTTLAKGIGVYGGAVLGATRVIDAIRADASAYVCTTPIPPALAETARTALGVHTCEGALLVAMRGHAATIQHRLGELGLVDGGRLPLVPIFAFVLDPVERMDEFRASMLERGFDVPVIRYRGGPGERFVRLTVGAAHTSEQVEALLEAIESWMG